MSNETKWQGKRRWLAPLALCLAVCLAIHPVSLNLVQAEEGDVSAFWDEVTAFWEKGGAFDDATAALFWGDEEKGITGAMKAYYDAQDNGEDLAAAREAVYSAKGAFDRAYPGVMPAYEKLSAKFDALTDEEKAYCDSSDSEACSPQDAYDGIKLYVQGGEVDGESFPSLEDFYQNSCNEYEVWNYWDNASQFWEACDSFGPASDKLYGNEENGITGAIPSYNDALYNNGDVNTAYKAVVEAAQNMKDVDALIKKIYAAMGESYEKIPDNVRKDKDEDDEYAQSIEENYAEATKSKEELGSNYEDILKNLNVLEYTAGNLFYWNARDLFYEATNNFEGNEGESITGAHPAYMAALESESEEMYTLYENAVAAQAAVEEAYKAMTEKYQAENAAFEALTGAEQQSPYGDDGTVLADIHTEIVEDYTTGWVPETYERIHECEIPAPPQKEDPEPTTPPSEDKPGSTDTPGSDSPAPVIDYFTKSIQNTEQSIAAAEKGSTVEIVTKGSVTLTSGVMRTLIDNPTVSLYLEYTYNGQEYKVLIPAGQAFVVEGIEYYGPLYLYSLFPYDGRETDADTVEYTIVKGDTLTKIARMNNTTVSELIKINRIKDPNQIRPGQRIVVPAK